MTIRHRRPSTFRNKVRMRRSVARTLPAALVAVALLATSTAAAAATLPAPATTAVARGVVAVPVGSDRCSGSSQGRLLDTTELQRLPRTAVADTLRNTGIATDASYGVRLLRLVYCTVAPSGSPAVASGLLALPEGATGRLSVVVYAHGTVAARADAPSYLRTVEGQLVPLIFAAEGFAVAAPDYVGLGASTTAHPYLHARTEASASVDLLSAVRTSVASLGAPISRDVFLTGHSQGGHAAMAIGSELARTPGQWRLRALAPMAGPYDMSGLALPAALDPERTDPAIGTVLLAYLLTSWDSLYHLYADPHAVFASPYADIVEGLFDGTHGVDAIDQILPDSPAELLQPDILAQLADPDGRLGDALRDNDVCRWAPTVPTRLYVGRADRVVVPEHARRCQDHIAARGGRAEVVDLGYVDHIATAKTALPLIRAWFLSLAAS